MAEFVVKFASLESVVLAADSVRHQLETYEAGRHRSVEHGYSNVGGVYESVMPRQFSALCELTQAMNGMTGLNQDAYRRRNGDLWIRLTDGAAKLKWLDQWAWLGMIHDAEQVGLCDAGTYEQAVVAHRAARAEAGL